MHNVHLTSSSVSFDNRFTFSFVSTTVFYTIRILVTFCHVSCCHVTVIKRGVTWRVIPVLSPNRKNATLDIKYCLWSCQIYVFHTRTSIELNLNCDWICKVGTYTITLKSTDLFWKPWILFRIIIIDTTIYKNIFNVSWRILN